MGDQPGMDKPSQYVTSHLGQLNLHPPGRLIEYQLGEDWIGLCSVLRPHQHSIGYMGDGFYRSRDPTNSIKVLKEMLQKTNQTTETTQNRHA